MRMIALENVSKTYRVDRANRVTAVQDVSLRIECGEFAVITGRSGSGKTTLLNLIAGLTKPTDGEVRVGGVDVWEMGDGQQSALRNQKIGFIFQFPSLLPSLTVLDNVALPAAFGPRSGRAMSSTRARDLLEEVRLSDKLYAYPRQLSAGQQQRVVVARSLMNRPDVLLADEPTSNLDEQTEQEILDLIRKIHRSLGITIVMVTHTGQLVAYGTRAFTMAAGRIVSDSATSSWTGGMQ